MITPNYRGTQQDLYSICKLAWNSCSQHLADFTGFKSKYDAAFITFNNTAIAAAEALPDDQTRSGESEILRIHLKENATTALALWQKIKRYNADAFPESEQKARNEQAGADYYFRASQDNWDSVQGLLTSGEQFLITNDTVLLDNGFMPATFAASFHEAKVAFNTQHQLFLDSEETARQGTQAKLTANNYIHKELMVMMLDGQEIFKDDEATKKQFIYNEVLSLVSGVGQAGLRGLVSTVSNNTPIANAIIGIPSIGKETLSADDGRYTLVPVNSGTYTIEVTAEGYEPLTIENKTVSVGTVSALNIQLTSIDEG